MSESVFLSNLHYFCAQTDGAYKFPNSAEGDLLKRAKIEVEVLQRENAALREENAEWREMIREAVFDNNDILYWIRGARSILLDEVEKDCAARKKAQP